jgi:hypothetical protein
VVEDNQQHWQQQHTTLSLISNSNQREERSRRGGSRAGEAETKGVTRGKGKGRTSIGGAYSSVSRFRRTTLRGKESALHSGHASPGCRTSMINVRLDCKHTHTHTHTRPSQAIHACTGNKKKKKNKRGAQQGVAEGEERGMTRWSRAG